MPAIIKWPGKIPAGSGGSEMTLSMDVLPTFAHITGAALPTVMPLDGKNMIDLLTAKPGAKTAHDYIFYVDNAVRSGEWKYHKKELFKVTKTASDTHGPTLYNLKADIGESVNLIVQYLEVAERLRIVLENQIKITSAKEEIGIHTSVD